MEIQRVTSHPIHLVDNNIGALNPTAFVPFCSISDNYSAMGVKIDQIDVPVCNRFMPKVRRNQICYTVDLDKIRKETESKGKVYFIFFIDYNEDRDISVARTRNENEVSKNKNEIIVETIGKYYFSFQFSFQLMTRALWVHMIHMIDDD